MPSAGILGNVGDVEREAAMKPRNLFAPAAKMRSGAGAHGKSRKAQRRKEKMDMRKITNNPPDGGFLFCLVRERLLLEIGRKDNRVEHSGCFVTVGFTGKRTKMVAGDPKLRREHRFLRHLE